MYYLVISVICQVQSRRRWNDIQHIAVSWAAQKNKFLFDILSKENRCHNKPIDFCFLCPQTNIKHRDFSRKKENDRCRP